MRQSGERAIILLSQRLEPKVETKEGDADEKGHNHARLLSVSADQQNPPRQCQLAAHLERLPPEVCRFVVGRQIGGRAAQRGWNASPERVAARPQQPHIQQGDAHWPQGEHRKGRGLGVRVLVRVARERQVGVQVAPGCVAVVLERLAQDHPEDPRRSARQHQEGEAERRR
eukprot:2766351-Prymnesium_polylepis.1